MLSARQLGEFMRRLPVYLLIDTSGSMSGEPIEAVKNGLQLLHSSLRKDPQAMETAFISVITFNSSASQIIPLTEVASFKPPSVTASGGTSLGAALNLVVDSAAKEVNKGTADEKGDWKPLVFLMTDGMPTDNVEPGIKKFLAAKWGMVVACAAGQGADTALLQRIAGENVVLLDTCNSSTISAYFKFVSTSIATSSKKIDSGSEVGSLSELPPPPPEISLLKI
jgi:uncharacterized protein YegL